MGTFCAVQYSSKAHGVVLWTSGACRRGLAGVGAGGRGALLQGVCGSVPVARPGLLGEHDGPLQERAAAAHRE